MSEDLGTRKRLEENEVNYRRRVEGFPEAIVVHSGAETLKTLRGLGVRFAIDDFGTGYSSLPYLARLPAGLIKLDGSFVGGIGEDDAGRVLLSGVIGIARGLGVCAEAVETAEQATRLREFGCGLAQGHHFSQPLTGEAAADFWKRQGA